MTDMDCYEEENHSAELSESENDAGLKYRKAALYLVLLSTVIASLVGVVHILTPTSVTAQALQKKTPEPTIAISHVPTDAPAEKKQRSVLLDAGHGGFDPGTEGTKTGIPESKVNLAITKKIQSKLEEKGYLVLMTRTDDNAIASGKKDDMKARVAIISRSNADVFVSIHQNAMDSESVCGCEVYYHETMPKSEYLAKCVEKRLSQIEGAAPSRGVKTYDHMLTSHLRYSILIECGFLTNPEEEAKLTSEDYQDKLADAVVEGIEDFFNDYFEE